MRFIRQTELAGFGPKAQARLRDARVLVVGAGGLGCPVILYLAAAGIGTLGVADADVVDISNLHRQILYGIADIGRLKTTVVAERIEQMYGDVVVNTYDYYLHPDNAVQIIVDYDVVIDATDNFGTRYLLNDICTILNKPMIMGSLFRYEGLITVFNTGDSRVNYRDMFPVQPDPSQVPGCNDTGVLGVLPGIIGTLQAAEAIKIVAKIGQPLTGHFLVYNMLNNNLGRFSIEASHNRIGPQTLADIAHTHYESDCTLIPEITWSQAEEMITIHPEQCIVVDVRESNEQPRLRQNSYINLPLSRFDVEEEALRDRNVLLFCQTGQRSRIAAGLLLQAKPNRRVYNIAGGIMQADPHLRS